MEKIINLKNVNKTFSNGKSKFEILKDISFEVEKGDFIAITGSSGSGKTTLLNLLGLLLRPTSGEYTLNNKTVNDVTEKESAILRNSFFGYVVQDFALINQYTVMQNILVPVNYAPKRVRASVNAEINEYLERLNIANKKHEKVCYLSGGEKQRVAIARALINNPQVILADEPTGSLDSQSTKNIMEILIELSSEGKTVIVVTHEGDVAAKCRSRLHVSDGQIFAK